MFCLISPPYTHLFLKPLSFRRGEYESLLGGLTREIWAFELQVMSILPQRVLSRQMKAFLAGSSNEQTEVTEQFFLLLFSLFCSYKNTFF